LIQGMENVVAVAPAKGLYYGGSVYGIHTLMLTEDAESICVAGSNYTGQLGTGNTGGNIYNFECSVGMISEVGNPLLTEETVIIFPNPVNDLLHFRCEREPLGFEIYDFHGNLIRNVKMTDMIGVIDFSDIPEGIYIAKFNFSDGIVIKKVIKTK